MFARRQLQATLGVGHGGPAIDSDCVGARPTGHPQRALRFGGRRRGWPSRDARIEHPHLGVELGGAAPLAGFRADDALPTAKKRQAELGEILVADDLEHEQPFHLEHFLDQPDALFLGTLIEFELLEGDLFSLTIFFPRD